jgi:ABC-type multidrug transport system ATPase subunit
MRIELDQVGKRYQNEWIVKNVSLELKEQGRYAVTGPNGSGKSTLLKMISGHLSPSKGKVSHFIKDEKLDINEVYRHVSYAAPYIDLIEDLTLTEAIQFHQNFKPFLNELTVKDIIELLGFKKSRNKAIKYFSSGMKQRLKLALAICSDSSLLLLDEPTTNLDRQGVEWYLELIEAYRLKRLIIVASNVEEDYKFCSDIISILRFK